MQQVTLRAETGRPAGSRVSRRLRRDGRVPAVVYGKGHESVAVAVNARDLYGALHTESGLNALINLDMGSESLLTIAREVQRHPVRGEIIHLDFIQISLDETITADVVIEFLGVPEGVRNDGGVVETVQNTVEVEALPMAIPSSIELDISEMGVNDSAKVSDLPELEGVTYLSDPDSTLISIQIPRVLVVEEPEPALDEFGEPILVAEGDEDAEAVEGEDGDEDEGDED